MGNRYYNPPDEVPRIGRPLRRGTFAEFQAQLQGEETVIGLFTNQSDALVAAEVPSQERVDQLNREWPYTAFEFYAVPTAQAEEGFKRR
jgi:hypothetical protein